RVVPQTGEAPVDITQQINIPGVTARRVGAGVVIEGTVNTEDEARRAMDVARLFSEKVINLITVRPGPVVVERPLAEQVQAAIQIPGITARSAGKTVVLEGRAADAAQKDR